MIPDIPQAPSDTLPRPEDGLQPTDQTPNYIEVEVSGGQDANQ